MRKKGYLPILILIFFVLLIVFIPYLDGVLFKSKLIDLVSNINNDKRVSVEILEYHLGWRHSFAKIRITPLNNRIPALFPLSPVSLPLVLEEKITHGPFVYNPATHFISFAYGKMRSVVHLPDSLESTLLSDQKKGFMQINSIMGFNNKWENNIKISPINTTLMGDELQWGGLQSTINFWIDQNKINKLDVLMNIAALSMQEKQQVQTFPFPQILDAQIKASSYRNQSSLQAIGLWGGSSEFVMPGWIVKYGDGTVYSLDNFNFAVNYGVSNAYYNVLWKLTAKDIKTPTFISEIAPLTINLNFSNFNAQGIVDFIAFAQSMQVAQIKNNYEEVQSKLLGIFTPASKINLDILMNTSRGDFSLNNEIFLPKESFPLKSIEDVGVNANVHLNLKISIQLVDQLISAYNLRSGGIETPPPPPTAQPPEEENPFAQKVAQLVKAGKLTVPVSLKVMEIASSHPSLPIFISSIDALNLSADIATDLKQQYSAYDFKLEQQKAAAAAELKQNEAQAMNQPSNGDQVHQQLNEMIKQGYIKIVGKDYVVEMTRIGGIIKLNGIVFNPQTITPTSGIAPGPVITPPNPNPMMKPMNH